MRKKKLPDHHVSFDDAIVEFSVAQIDQFQAKFEFSKSYPLGEALDHIALFYEQKNYYKPLSPVSEQKELFNAILQSALNMEEAIKRLGRAELLLIGRQNCDWISHTKIDQVSEIRRVAERALKDLSEKSSLGGRPKKTTEQELIYKLAKIYHDGTGRTDHYGHGQYAGKLFTGRRVEFIEEVVTILGAPVDNQFIGKTLKVYFSPKSKTPS